MSPSGKEKDMTTLSKSAVKSAYIESQIREEAIGKTIKQWRKALTHYYKTSEGGRECTRLWHELIHLKVDSEALMDIDFEIRDKYAKEEW